MCVFYSWSRMEGEMPRGVLSQGSRLVIDNARPTHAGTYTCRVNTNLTSQVILLVTGLVPYFGQVSSISSALLWLNPAKSKLPWLLSCMYF